MGVGVGAGCEGGCEGSAVPVALGCPVVDGSALPEGPPPEGPADGPPPAGPPALGFPEPLPPGPLPVPVRVGRAELDDVTAGSVTSSGPGGVTSSSVGSGAGSVSTLGSSSRRWPRPRRPDSPRPVRPGSTRPPRAPGRPCRTAPCGHAAYGPGVRPGLAARRGLTAGTPMARGLGHLVEFVDVVRRGRTGAEMPQLLDRGAAACAGQRAVEVPSTLVAVIHGVRRLCGEEYERWMRL